MEFDHSFGLQRINVERVSNFLDSGLFLMTLDKKSIIKFREVSFYCVLCIVQNPIY